MSWLQCRATVLGLFLLAACMLPGPSIAAGQEHGDAGPTARVIPVDGPIGPATSRFVTQQLSVAEDNNAELVILRIDTPGGLSRAMHDIVQAILASPIPVVGYVAPHGARAASAGTYILYATHIAAMAPATHLGAATPVSLLDMHQGAGKDDNKPTDNDTSATDNDNASAERRKVINDAVSFIRSLALQRDRNADWAEDAVRNAATLTATQARDKDVIDLIADNRMDLLHEIDGMTVHTAVGDITLHTNGMQTHVAEPGWQTQLLSIITQPSVAYLLLMIGIFGLLLEGLHPGIVLPGVVGAICLLVALYALQILPINYAGLGLMLLGIILMVAEAFAPSFGALGLGGIAAFVFGSVMLMNTNVPGYQVPYGIIIGTAIGFGLLILLVIAMFAHARKKRIHTGTKGLIGSECTAATDFAGDGRVWLHGESWQARCEVPVKQGDILLVTAYKGLTVTVHPPKSKHDV